MITVAGEALMDVIVGPGGALRALPGGAPFNAARAIAALGADCTYLGRLSDDRFGDELRNCLAQAGVRLALPQPSRAPTPLAIAELDAAGSARYRFYHHGTACARVAPDETLHALLAAADLFVFGGIVLTLEPVRSTLLGLLTQAPRRLPVLCDPNCRPDAIQDIADYRQRFASVLGRVDIVKASVEDLDVLVPGSPAVAAALDLIALGPAAVLITDGARAARIVTADEVCEVPVEPVEVIDTIGAGDAFVAGFTSWWAEHGLDRASARDLPALRGAVRYATEVAARACRVQGAGLAA